MWEVAQDTLGEFNEGAWCGGGNEERHFYWATGLFQTHNAQVEKVHALNPLSAADHQRMTLQPSPQLHGGAVHHKQSHE